MVLGGSRGLLCRLVMGYSKHLELPNRVGLLWGRTSIGTRNAIASPRVTPQALL